MLKSRWTGTNLLLVVGAVLLFPAAAGSETETETDAETLNPHYSNSLCTSCHVDAEKYELLSDDQVSFCTSCHGSSSFSKTHHPLRAVPAGISPPKDWPTLANSLTCFTCHLPCNEVNRGAVRFLRDGPYKKMNHFCDRCHDPALYKEKNPHEEASRAEGDGCDFCHDYRPVPGKDILATVSFCADPTVLCQRCHDKHTHPAGFMHTRRLSEEEKVLVDGSVSLYKGDTIICSTCHNPHVSESKGHKLRTGVSEISMCPGCHTF